MPSGALETRLNDAKLTSPTVSPLIQHSMTCATANISGKSPSRHIQQQRMPSPHAASSAFRFSTYEACAQPEAVTVKFDR